MHLRLTIDLWRISAFSASLFAQLLFPSISAIALSEWQGKNTIRTTDENSHDSPSCGSDDKEPSWRDLMGLHPCRPPQFCAALFSIGLCISLALAFRDARAQDPSVSWMVNSKDLVAETINTSAHTTLFGKKRVVNLKPHIFPTRRTFIDLGGAIGAYGI